MNPEAPSSLDPITQANIQSTQPAPSEAPAAASQVVEPPQQTTPPASDAPIDAAWQSPLKQIRTYQGDIAEVIKFDHESLVSIRAAEKAREDLLKTQAVTAPAREEAPAPAEKRPSVIVPVLLLLGGLILLGGAGVAGYYAYETYAQKTAVPVTEVPQNRFLAVVNSEDFNTSVGTRDALVSLLGDMRQHKVADGSIEQAELRNGTSTAPLTTTTEFMLLLEAKPSGALVRSFNPLFMLGVIGEPAAAPITIATTTATTTKAVAASSTASSTASLTASSTIASTLMPADMAQTFLLIKIDSFDNAYAGMLDWEKSLKEDILPLFHSADTIATIPNNAAWSDATIKNKDARILTDASGKTQLIYSFYNQNLLIITGSTEALRTILDELDTQALAR